MEVFIELGIILAITTGIAILMRIIKQPLVVGYIISGIVLGPYVFNVLQSTEQIELFSKIGISTLLFILGLSLSPQAIKETGKVSLITGIGQIIFTSAIGFGIAALLGYGVVPALYIAVALTFSSTIIILKLLSDRGDLNKLYGKISIGFLLVQDFAATLLLILVPIIGAQIIGTGAETGNSIFLGLFVKGFAGIAIIYGVAKWILPRLSKYLAKSQELLFCFR